MWRPIASRMLLSTAGALYIVTGFETGLGFRAQTRRGPPATSSWRPARRDRARRPRSSRPSRRNPPPSTAEHARARRREQAHARRTQTARGALADFLAARHGGRRARLRGAVQVHRCARRRDDGAVRDRSRIFAHRLCQHHQGASALPRRCSAVLPAAMWRAPSARQRACGSAASCRRLANFAFTWQAHVGKDVAWLSFAITVENFTSAIGTVIFVGYLSALCRNPLHTATQFALLTALSAVGRTISRRARAIVAEWTGWAWFFAICAFAGIPGLAAARLAAGARAFRELEPTVGRTRTTSAA